MPSKKVQEESSEQSDLYHVSNLYSEQELKKVTQDFFSEKIRGAKYEENVKYSNICIFLSLVLIFIGAYCTIFVSYKKQPSLMIQLIIAFFTTSIILFIFEYIYFENSFIILKADKNANVKLTCTLNKEEKRMKLFAKLDKKENSTSLDLAKLFDANGYLNRSYAASQLHEFLLICEKKYNLRKKKN